MMKKMKKTVRGGIGLIILLAVLAACGNGQNTGKVLNIAREIPSNSLDYLKNELVNNAQIIANFSEGLMTYDQNGKLTEGLAESWSKKDNVYTFTLRKDLKWSNGEPLTAKDFVFGWQTIATLPEAPYRHLLSDLKNGEAVIRGESGVETLGVKAVDDITLEVMLAHDRAYFIEMLGHTTFLPLNETFYTRLGAENYGTSPETLLASGPFVLAEYNPSEGYTMRKNVHYWNASNIALDTVNTRVIKESATQDTLYENDELDVLEVPANLYDKYKDNPNLVEMGYGRLFYLYLSGNTGTSDVALANADFRRAIGYAINKKLLADSVFKDGSVGLDYLVPTDFGNVEGKPYRTFLGEGVDNIYKFDVTKAQAYLAKAKEALPAEALTVKILYQEREEHKRVFENIQAQVEANLPGVKVSVESMPGQTYFSELSKKATPAGYSGWTPAYNDMSTYFQNFLTDNSLNFSNYQNPAYDKLYWEAQDELNPAKRAKIFQQAEQMLLDDGVIVPLAQRGKRYVVKEKVKNFNFNSTFPEINFRYITVV